jgi:hypothetical protein
VAIAHDPLTSGRPRAFVGIGEPLRPPGRSGGERELLAALRRALPLTCGQIVAHAAVTGGADPAEAVERAVHRARDERRPIEPVLEVPTARPARVAEAVAAVRRLGREHAAVRRAARTYGSALEAVP